MSERATVATEFDPRSNSIGFVRWLMAFMVIFSHAGPVGGFYGGEDLGKQWSDEQSLGGVAVVGFFFLSGFLITRSRVNTRSTVRFFWRRLLRIMPAFWLALLVTAFLFGPIAWIRETGSIDGYFTATVDSPLTYFVNNMFLVINQENIAEMGSSTPLAQSIGLYHWNGSAWTLGYEFLAYIMVGILGLIGALAHRIVAGVVAVAIIGLATLQWAGALGTTVGPLFTDYRALLLFAPFAFGMLFALFGEKIPIDGRLAIALAIFSAFTFAKGGWLILGQYAFLYVLFWFSVRVKSLRNWERHGDFSYGIYIFAWPIMQLAGYFDLGRFGWLA